MRTICLLALFVCLAASGGFSQAENYDEAWRLVRFTTESGLPSNQVSQAVETADGIVWVGTSAGPAWFDGYEWHSIDSSAGIPPGRVTRLIADGPNRILTIVSNRLYGGNQSGFRQIPIHDVADAVSFGDSSALILTYYSTTDTSNVSPSSLYLFRHDSLKLFPASVELTYKKTRSIYKTSSGSIWIDVENGLYKWENGKWDCKIPAVEGPFIIEVLEENDAGNGLTYIGARGRPIEGYEWTRNTLPRKNPSERGHDTRAVAINDSGDVIASTIGGEVLMRRHKSWRPLTFFQHQLKKVEAYKFRKNGDLWLGTSDGLFLYKHSSTRWHVHGHLSGSRNNITEIMPSRSGDIWLGSPDGLEILKPDGTIQSVNRILGAEIYDVTGLCEADDGAIWISSGGAFQGAYRWDGKSWSYFHLGGDSERVWIHKIRNDLKGRLWFLGLSDLPTLPGQRQPGAFVLEHGHFTRWGEEEGLINGRVYAFAQGRDSALWFGTFGGISRLWKDKWTHWTVNNGLVANVVFAITLDSSNRLWFTDRLNGVGRLDDSGVVRYVSTSGGLIGPHVWDLSTASDGTIWFGTREGVGSYHNGIFSNFDSRCGLVQPEVWPVLPRDGKVYIGTEGNGLVVLDTRDDTTHSPRVSLEKPVIETEQAFLRWRVYSWWLEESPQNVEVRYRLNGGSWSSWSTAREVTFRDLSPSTYTFEIQSKTLFGNISPAPQTAAFTIALPFYRLPWVVFSTSIVILAFLALGINQIRNNREHAKELRESEAKFRRLTEATFEGVLIHERGFVLDANQSLLDMFGYAYHEFVGQSILKFIAQEFHEILRGQMESDSEDSLEVVAIRKDGSSILIEITGKSIPFEQRMARVMALRDVTERKRAEERLLAYQEQLRSLATELSATEERERRRMAEYLHDQIGQALAMCKMRLERVRDGEESANIEETRQLLQQVIDNTRSLTLDLSPPVLRELNFADAINWLTSQFQTQHDILIYFEDDKRPKSPSTDVKTFLYHATRELLTNIVKHAHAQSAEVILRTDDRSLSIEVSDDGIGFDATKIQREHRNDGFGLFNIRERLIHYGGTLETTRPSEGGACVIMTVPLQLPGNNE